MIPENKNQYRTLSVDTAIDYLSGIEEVQAKLGGNTEAWKISEIGDGNLNLVFHIQSEHHSIIAKQALPYIRARGEKWQLPLSRAYFEREALLRHEKRAPGMTPAVVHFDHDMALIIMEYLEPHIILRKGLVRGEKFPRVADDLGLFLANTLFKGSNFSMEASEKRADIALFSANSALCEVTEARVFTEPYYEAELNRWTSPQLDNSVSLIRQDSKLKTSINEMKAIFMNSSQALLHGDLHSGSVMVTDTDTRIIDPEFAFYGPMGFDIGALIGNYLLAYMAQNGHISAENDRAMYSEWILGTVQSTWNTFDSRFRQLWKTERTGGLFPENVIHRQDQEEAVKALDLFLQRVLQDAIGFAGAKMMRRIIGAAHVEDLETISDPNLRAKCEKHVIALARKLLLHRNDYWSMADVVAITQDIRKKDPE